MIPKSEARLPVGWIRSPIVWGALGTLSTLSLLAAPLPTAWLGLIGLIVLSCAAWWTQRHITREIGVWLPAALYVSGALVGLSITVRPDTAEIRLFGILAGFAAFLSAVMMAETPRSARRLALGMLAFAAVAATIVFLLVSPFLDQQRYPPALTGWLTGLEPVRQWVLDQDDILQRYRLRASGLGTLAAFGVALLLGPLLSGPNTRTRVFGTALLGYFVLLLLLAGNRGAMLSAALVTMILVLSRNRWLLGAGLLTSAAVLGVVSGLIRLNDGGQTGRLLRVLSGPTTDPGSVIRRVEFWDNSIYLLGDFPFTGVGLGLRSVQEIYETYFLPVDPRFSHSHNIFLQTYLEQGPLGLLGLSGIVALTAVVAWRALGTAHDVDSRWVAVSATAATLTLVIAGLTEVVALTTVGMVMYGLALGLLVAIERTGAAERHVPAGRSPEAVAVLATVALVVGLLGFNFSKSRAFEAVGPVQATLASLNLNAGNIELMKVSVGVNRPRAERDERLTRAEQYLLRASEHDQGSVSARRSLAAVHAVQSQRSAARRLLEEAETLVSSDDQRTKFQIGRVYRDANEVDRAADLWVEAGAAPQLVQWGGSLVRRSQWRQALNVNRAGIRAAPTERSPWQGLAQSVDQISGRRATLITMERLAGLYPSVPWPYLAAGDLFAAEGDSGTAREWYTRGLHVSPGEPLLLARMESTSASESARGT